jgi:hypothetical protein
MAVGPFFCFRYELWKEGRARRRMAPASQSPTVDLSLSSSRAMSVVLLPSVPSASTDRIVASRCNSAPMRLEGLEPPRAFAHTDLNRARRPIPPQPRDAELSTSRCGE